MKIFVDAGPWHAINSPRDQYYKKAQELTHIVLAEKFRLVTTDYIIDESLTSLLTTIKGTGYQQAMNLISWTRKNPKMIQFEWVTPSRYTQALKIFQKYNQDKLWSFTDCTSYVVMKELKIDTIFTFDDHFQQMGFKV